jgi:RHS repeat-associated protein
MREKLGAHLLMEISIMTGYAKPSMPRHQSYCYTAYGKGSIGVNLLLSAFSDERFDEVSQAYPLGNGARYYKPCIHRFTSSDELSPFGKGGSNAYAYCQGDPVNRHDPSGQFWVLRFLLRSAARTTAILSREFSSVVQDVARAADQALTATAREFGRQFAPALGLAHNVIAAAAVPTEQSMRVNPLLNAQPVQPQEAQPRSPMSRQLVASQADIRRSL